MKIRSVQYYGVNWIPLFGRQCIDNLKQCLYLKCSYLKCSYLKMCSHGNALAVPVFRRCARLRSRAYDFNCIIEKRRGKLGHYVSFNEIHVLYSAINTATQNTRIWISILSFLTRLFGFFMMWQISVSKEMKKRSNNKVKELLN